MAYPEESTGLHIDPSLARTPERGREWDGPRTPSGEFRIGAVLLGVTAGTQAMLAAILLIPRRMEPAVVEQLTARGRFLFRPEYDLTFYETGCLVSLALAYGLSVWEQRGIRRTAESVEGGSRAFRAGLPLLLAILATVAFLASLALVPPPPDPRPLWRVVSLVGPGLLAVLAFLVLGRRETGLLPVPTARRPRWTPLLIRTAPGRDWRADPPAGAPADPAPCPGNLADLAVAILIVLLLAIPSCSRLAGRFAVLDGVPFHHWDYFVMGPALRYLHGGALGTEIYSQYGVAWPVIFARLTPWIGLSYGNVLVVSLLCGVIYFVGIFLVLRLFLNSTAWAATGVVLAIAAQMHHGVIPEMTIWLTPSSTVLRSPMDVWFFLALWLHGRSGRRRWIFLTGTLVGLGILFETDTGLYLAATLGFYLACLPGCPAVPLGSAGARGKAFFSVASLGMTVTAATTLGGLTIASRGTLLHHQFWSGWLEPLRLYHGGMSALPITLANGLAAPLLFLTMVGTYLTLLGLLLVALHGRRAPRGLLLGGCLSAYGLCQLLQYVNRSHEFNIYHACIAFCVIWVSVAALALRRLAGCGPARVWAPRVALGLALSALAASPSFWAYPHPWDRLVRKQASEGLKLMPGVRGLPDARLEEVEEFRAVVRWLRGSRLRGTTVGVLDPADTRFYLASGCPPWGRYASLVMQIIRKDQLAAAEEQLSAGQMDYWIAREADPRVGNWRDVQEALLGQIQRHYVLEDRIGHYGIWRTRGIRPSQPPDQTPRVSDARSAIGTGGRTR
jgi:hypothetical protein